MNTIIPTNIPTRVNLFILNAFSLDLSFIIFIEAYKNKISGIIINAEYPDTTVFVIMGKIVVATAAMKKIALILPANS